MAAGSLCQPALGFGFNAFDQNRHIELLAQFNDLLEDGQGALGGFGRQEHAAVDFHNIHRHGSQHGN